MDSVSTGGGPAVTLRREDFTLARSYWMARALDAVGGVLLPFRDRGPIPEPASVLVIRPDHLGDVLVSTPAIHALRLRFPNARLVCAVGPWAAPVLAGNPDVDEVVPLALPWLDRRPVRTGWWRMLSTVGILRRRRFDLSVDLRPDPRGVWVSWLIGARRRLGSGHKGGGFFLTDHVPWAGEAHAIDLALRIAERLGAPAADRRLRLAVSAGARGRSRRLLAGSVPSGPGLLVAVAPVAGHGINWTATQWREACAALVERTAARLVFLGGREAAGMVEEVRAGLPGLHGSLAGRTSVEGLAAVLGEVALLVALDSGVRHVAAAVGTPVVFLRPGANSSVVWGPDGPEQVMLRHEVPCSPCGVERECPLGHVDCLRRIPAEMVAAAVETTLSGTGGGKLSSVKL